MILQRVFKWRGSRNRGQGGDTMQNKYTKSWNDQVLRWWKTTVIQSYATELSKKDVNEKLGTTGF